MQNPAMIRDFAEVDRQDLLFELSDVVKQHPDVGKVPAWKDLLQELLSLTAPCGDGNGFG
jgi:hypothetical protein